jgi:hypothetical protein
MPEGGRRVRQRENQEDAGDGKVEEMEEVEEVKKTLAPALEKSALLLIMTMQDVKARTRLERGVRWCGCGDRSSHAQRVHLHSAWLRYLWEVLQFHKVGSGASRTLRPWSETATTSRVHAHAT